MERSEILALFDQHASLEHCLEKLLRESTGSQLHLAVSLVRAAMEMPDQSGSNIKTTVHSIQSSEILHVGEGEIHILGPLAQPRPRRSKTSDLPVKITLVVDEPMLTDTAQGGASEYQKSVATFVATSITLRSACNRATIRKWLASFLAA